jgi:hypothetical protein
MWDSNIVCLTPGDISVTCMHSNFSNIITYYTIRVTKYSFLLSCIVPYIFIYHMHMKYFNLFHTSLNVTNELPVFALHDFPLQIIIETNLFSLDLLIYSQNLSTRPQNLSILSYSIACWVNAVQKMANLDQRLVNSAPKLVNLAPKLVNLARK